MPTAVGWEIQTKDRRRREGGTAIFSELKIADFPRLCVASLKHARNCKNSFKMCGQSLTIFFQFEMSPKKRL